MSGGACVLAGLWRGICPGWRVRERRQSRGRGGLPGGSCCCCCLCLCWYWCWYWRYWGCRLDMLVVPASCAVPILPARHLFAPLSDTLQLVHHGGLQHTPLIAGGSQAQSAQSLEALLVQEYMHKTMLLMRLKARAGA
eukprot:1159568-Pelagomonas_calceolata.AAC.9